MLEQSIWQAENPIFSVQFFLGRQEMEARNPEIAKMKAVWLNFSQLNIENNVLLFQD